MHSPRCCSRRFSGAQGSRASAAVAFVASPLATLATGWVGASSDQLYVIFLLLVAGIALKQVANGITLRGATGVVLFTAAALLCDSGARSHPIQARTSTSPTGTAGAVVHSATRRVRPRAL